MNKNLDLIINLIKKGYKICTDSRKATKGNIFIALKGDLFNGNNFALNAIESGCEYAIIDEDIKDKHPKIIKVDNCLLFLQELAKKYRNQFEIPVLAITGSNGKTTTKELITKVLSKKFNVLSTKGNLNNHIGAPLTILELKNSHEIAIIEIGANQPGEIAMLSEIVNPTHGIITNIGKAHLEGFKNIETIIETKGALYRHLIKNSGVIFQRGENEILKNISLAYNRIIKYGEGSNNELQGTLINSKEFLKVEYFTNSIFGACKRNVDSIVESHLTGIYNFENILSAISVGLYFGVSEKDINKAIEEYTPDNSRSQIINNGNNLIFMDAYNANPTSMLASLESFLTFGADPKVLILGDMLEMGDYAEQEHENILRWIDKHKFQQVLLIGKVFHSLQNKYQTYHYFEEVNAANKWIAQNEINKSTVLIKGSRGIKLEVLLTSL
ncbi:MAG: UDP-N-acetylmuramoyl-tripeptide--D-alanyl-D-alanine ligase [Bacteroidetes bacterium]|nr:UDP-N-acetylmuramoyl-tripeptide--D-alanyl-D-alanine ligase [Bacteroidota bacterium]